MGDSGLDVRFCGQSGHNKSKSGHRLWSGECPLSGARRSSVGIKAVGTIATSNAPAPSATHDPAKRTRAGGPSPFVTSTASKLSRRMERSVRSINGKIVTGRPSGYRHGWNWRSAGECRLNPANVGSSDEEYVSDANSAWNLEAD